MRAPSRFFSWSACSCRSSGRRLRALIIGGSILTGSSRLLAAEPEPSSEASASPAALNDSLRYARRRLLERAKERYEAGRGSGEDARLHLEQALDALVLAYRLGPAPWLLFNLAQVQSRLGACREATELYEQFLASNPGPDAKSSAEEALALLGSCEESQREPSLSEGLSPGLRAQLSFDALFAAYRTGAAPASLPMGGAEATEDRGALVWPWALAGLSVTSGLAAAVFYGEARDAKQDLDQLRVAGPLVAQTQHRGESAQVLARVFGGVAIGLALAAGASYWWPRAEPSEAGPGAALERLSWLPLTGGGGASYFFEF